MKGFTFILFFLLLSLKAESQILIYGDHSFPVSGSVVSMSFSADNRFLACGTQTGSVYLLDLQAKKQLYELKHGSAVNTLVIDSKTRYVISGGNKLIIIWDLYTGNILKTIEDYKGKIYHIALDPDEKIISVSGSNNDISLYQIPDGTFLGSLRNGHTDETVYSAFSPSGAQLTSVGKDNQMILWEIAPKKLLRKSEIMPRTIDGSAIKVQTARMLPIANKILIACQESRLDKGGKSMIFKYNTAIYNWQSGMLEKIIEGNIKNIASLGVSPDGNFYVTDNSTLRVTKLNFWDIQTGMIVKNHQTEGTILSLNVSDRGDWLAIAEKNETSKSNEVKLFNLSGFSNVSAMKEPANYKEPVTKNVSSAEPNFNVPVMPLNIKGKYFALIIGINDYEDPNITDLDAPINDAQEVYKLITTTYTFNEEDVILLKNPRNHEIIEALDFLEKAITSNDNLLIFYAGHGKWDKETSRGYWLPADARLSSTANWFRNSTLTDYIASIKSKHTLLIADACFAGSIFKTRSVSEKVRGVERLYEKPSKKAMTSGTLEEVPDVSVFLKYFKKNLQENQEDFLPSEQLFYGMKTAVLNNSNNVPQYGEVKDCGDEGGDFIFVRRK